MKGKKRTQTLTLTYILYIYKPTNSIHLWERTFCVCVFNFTILLTPDSINWAKSEFFLLDQLVCYDNLKLVKRLCDCGCGCRCQLSPPFRLINNVINYELSFIGLLHTHTHTFGISNTKKNCRHSSPPWSPCISS